MLRQLWIFIFLVAVARAASLAHADGDRCVLPVPRFAFFMPLVFDPTGNLIQTDHIQNITLLSNDRIVLSCSPGYFKKMSTEQILRGSCEHGEVLKVNGEEKNWLKELGCEVRAIEEILTPVNGCPIGMESVEFGYVNPIKEKTLILGEACYSVENGRTIFVHTKVSGSANRQIAHLRTETKDYLMKSNHPASKYKIDLLLAARMDELNERLKLKLRTNKVPFLEARHFIESTMLQSKQFSSIMKLGWNFFVANGYDLVPNWDTLHVDVMQLVADTKMTFDVYMGTHGVLALPDADGHSVDIYLNDEEQRFPVPKYLWLVVQGDDDAAAFVVLNGNQTEDSNNELNDDEFCESKCDQLTWLKQLTKNQNHMNVAMGKVWCCDLQSFAAKVNELPAIDGHWGLLM